MDAAAACLAMGGIAWTRQLTAAGVPRRSLEAAATAGVLVRLHRGLYGHPSLDARLLHAARHGGRLACVDALRWHGLWVLPEAGLHVALAPGGHGSRHDCGESVIHHWNPSPPAKRWVVGVLTGLEQLSRCSTDEAFLVAVESARFTGRIRGEDLLALQQRVRPDYRAGLAFASGRSESGLETLTRWRLHHAGVECRQQVDVPLVGRVDLVVGDRLIIELDGREHHSSEAAFGIDRRRDAAAAAQGFVTLRFSYAQVVHNWPSVEAAVLSVVDEGLHETAAGRRHRSAAAH